MDKEKLIEVTKEAENKSNKSLYEALDDLTIEFDKTKELIVNLTRHLDTVTEMYKIVQSELQKRIKK